MWYACDKFGLKADQVSYWFYLVTAGFLIKVIIKLEKCSVTFFTRASEQLETLTGKYIKDTKQLTVSEFLLKCEWLIIFNNFDS